ncbi:hypothetical protein [Marinobacterium rhizophilum]|uniref:hypothetical protein n=1 Tax=Marinobacterium rhizophilum TaxID=420402 RepID=UPI00039B5089|nr:hypothetical protein [Marinobacterium rhizophilum]
MSGYFQRLIREAHRPAVKAPAGEPGLQGPGPQGQGPAWLAEGSLVAQRRSSPGHDTVSQGSADMEKSTPARHRTPPLPEPHSGNDPAPVRSANVRAGMVTPLNPLHATVAADDGANETPAATLADNRPDHGEPPGSAGYSTVRESHGVVSSSPAQAAAVSPSVFDHQPDPLAAAPFGADTQRQAQTAIKAREHGSATATQAPDPAEQPSAATADTASSGLIPSDDAPPLPESSSAGVVSAAWRSPDQPQHLSGHAPGARDDRPRALEAVHIGEIHIRVVDREPAARGKPGVSRGSSSGNDSRSLIRSL